MRYSCTGPTHPPTGLVRHVADVLLHQLTDGTEFTSGAAIGVDTAWALAAFAYYPKAKHRLIVPAAPHNEALVDWAADHGFEIVNAPRLADDASSYLARNDLLVATRFTDTLVAFPVTEEEILRSGTWATIRRARRSELPVLLRALEVAAA